MSRSEPLVRPTTDLLQRAAATSLNSARLIARSIELVARSVELMRQTAQTGERKSVRRIGVLLTRPARPIRRVGVPVNSDRAILLPLTAPRLLELAGEFRDLATAATTPESRQAFQDLAFRYTALAAGYDETRVGSRMMH
jgi:hypothetical protein